MGIIGYLLIVVGVPLLLVVLPFLLILFARGLRPLERGLWVLISLLPIVAMVSLDDYRFPTAIYFLLAWAIYFAFLWFGRVASVRRVRRRMGLALITVVFLGLAALSGVKIHADLVENASTHEVFWPLDSAGGNYLRLQIPAHYVGNRLQPTKLVSTSKPLAAPDRQGEISVSLLWPSLATRGHANQAEFDGFAPHVLSIDFHVLNRRSSDDRPINQLACEFEAASHDLGKDCFVVLPQSGSLATLAPRYGLARRGSQSPLKPNGPFSDDVWFALAENGDIETMIECPREGEGSVYSQCKHQFEVKAFNALAEVRYSRTYLSQWKGIQTALTSILVSMRRNNRIDQGHVVDPKSEWTSRHPSREGNYARCENDFCGVRRTCWLLHS